MQLIFSFFQKDMNAYIQLDGNISEFFKVRSGTKQGCVLAFILLPSFNMPLMGTKMEFTLRTRFDASLFNLERLNLKRLTTEALIIELLF